MAEHIIGWRRDDTPGSHNQVPSTCLDYIKLLEAELRRAASERPDISSPESLRSYLGVPYSVGLGGGEVGIGDNPDNEKAPADKPEKTYTVAEVVAANGFPLRSQRSQENVPSETRPGADLFGWSHGVPVLLSEILTLGGMYADAPAETICVTIFTKGEQANVDIAVKAEPESSDYRINLKRIEDAIEGVFNDLFNTEAPL